MVHLILAALLLTTATPALQDLAWIAGHWQGEHWGGKTEELWLLPDGGAMIGTFRHIKEGKLVFTEHQSIEQDDTGITLRIKHFGPKLIGWEEKADSTTFTLDRVTPDVASFSYTKEGRKVILEFQRKGPDEMHLLLSRLKDGTQKDDLFRYKRAPR
jgi:hypothetical protein